MKLHSTCVSSPTLDIYISVPTEHPNKKKIKINPSYYMLHESKTPFQQIVPRTSTCSTPCQVGHYTLIDRFIKEFYLTAKTISANKITCAVNFCN